MKGGKAIASGGYGCVFKPAIKCKYERDNLKLTKDHVSKLMYNDNAKNELNEILKFKPILNKIPDYKNYFMIDGIFTCEPSQLTLEDKEDFEKCRNFSHINKSNINSNLLDVSLLNIPYGGINLNTYLDSLQYLTVNKEQQCSFYNYKLIEVLRNGILPMNNLNLYHYDLKPDNLLIDDRFKEKSNIKLIDWGLSSVIKNKNDLKLISGRPIQYNVPFSVVLFNKQINDIINEGMSYLKINKSIFKDIGKREQMRIIATEIVDYLEIYKSGHYKIINERFIPIIYDHSYIFLSHILVNQFTNILEKYCNNYIFDYYLFFQEVFSKNVDIWGWLTCYLSLVEKNFDPVTKDSIKSILLEYLFSDTYSANPIPVDKLITQLNKIFIPYKQSSIQTVPHKSKSKSKSNSIQSIRYKKSKKSLKFLKTKKEPRYLGPIKTLSLTRKRCYRGYRKNKTGKCVKLK